MPQRLISKVELARLRRVSKPAVTKFLAKHPDALVRDRVDVDHPAVQAWLKSGGVKVPVESATLGIINAPSARIAKSVGPPPKPTKSKKISDAKPTEVRPSPLEAPPKRARGRRGIEGFGDQPDGAGSDEDLARLARALRPLLARFGTERNFKDWLDALKVIEDIRQRRNNNDEQEGRLIGRDLVRTHVFGAIDGSHRRLLGDAPKTLVRRVYAMASSGEGIEEAEATVREMVSKILEPVRATAKRILSGDGLDADASRS